MATLEESFSRNLEAFLLKLTEGQESLTEVIPERKGGTKKWLTYLVTEKRN